MRKSFLVLVLLAVVGLSTVAVAAGETFGGLPVVQVIVNGKALGTPGVVVEGRSMAPVRALAEALGAEVSWDQATQTATITTPDAKPQPPSPWNGVSTRTNPAGIGNTQTIFVKSSLDDYTAKVTLLEVVRGDQAWQKLQAANPYNDPPKDGQEYIVAKFRFELVTIAGGKALDVSPVQFSAISGTGRAYDTLITVTGPEPSLRTSLYAESTHEGWVTFAVEKTDTAPVVAYGRRFDGTGGIWFSLKTQ